MSPKRRAGIGGAVLRDRLLLLGDFERLDRDLHLAGAPVELDHARIDLLADREALRRAARRDRAPVRARLMKVVEIGADDLDVDAGLLHLGDLAGHDRALLERRPARSPSDRLRAA